MEGLRYGEHYKWTERGISVVRGGNVRLKKIYTGKQ